MNLFKRIFYFRNSLIVYSLFTFIINFFLIQLPLTGTFGYEFAAVNGLLFAIISGLHTLNFLSKSDYNLNDLVVNLSVLFFIPLFLAILKSLLTMFCSFWDGLFFYLMIDVTSIIFGVALAFITDLIFKRFKKLLFFVLILIVALIPIFEIYFLPQVYFYSPLIGFFPGNIYDEGLSPDLKLLIHQIIIIAICLLILFILIKKRRVINKHKFIFVITIIGVSLLVEAASGYLGIITTYSNLDSALNNKLETEKFVIHYDNLTDSEAKFVALSTDYYFEIISNELKVNPSKQINIYIFNNREQKKKLFGAGNADVAKPWQYAVYISADSWQNTLKHELVHVFSAEFGVGPFKLASGFNPALIEGIAEAIEGSTDEYSLIDFTSLAYQNNIRVNLNSLFSGLNFFKSNSSLSYSFSGAFIRYLINKYGIEKVKQLYSSNDFQNTFHNNLDSNIKEFENDLSRRSAIGSKSMADYYFGRVSILQKVCPRFVSDRLQIAYELLQSKNYDQAEKLFIEINEKTKNYSALLGLSEIFIERNNIRKAINLLETNLNKFEAAPYYYNLKFKLADFYSLSNQFELADNNYNYLIYENPNKDLVMISKIRKNLIENDLIKDYLTGNDSIMLNCILKLNDSSYNYASVPLLITLIEKLEIDYNTGIKYFDKTFIVNDLESSYAAFKLSEYLLANGDYLNARKYAALTLRYKGYNPNYFVMKENLKKATWFNNNYIEALKRIKFNN